MMVRHFAAAIAAAVTLSACVEDTGLTQPIPSADRKVLIQNQSGRTVYRFYGSNVGTSSWEEDILGSSVLPSGSSVRVDFYDGTGHCEFDFKIVFADGGSYEDFDINVCRISSYTIR